MHAGEGCDKTVLAYWAKDQPYSVIEIDPQKKFHTVGTAFLNGVKIRVLFDTGAATSFVTLKAAERAGVKPGDPGVGAAGSAHGIGQGSVNFWIAPFASFKIGDEVIHNTRLRIGELDLDLMDVDMLLGADFFLSHRIYVANSREKLYFTYSGGPVFNLTHLSAPPMGADGPPNLTAEAKNPSEEPTDAAGFSRRGAAYASRRDFERAIADLTRACELAPNEAKYYYQRGLARSNNHQPELAMADLDQALKLKPDDVYVLLKRAQLHLASGAQPAAVQDLDLAAGLAAKQADVRLEIASTYVHADRLAAAISQFDLWIAAHELDANMATALNGRCWARALLGSELEKALADCNAALDRMVDSRAFLDSRGLVYLRLGNYDKSIADYDAVLAQQPKSAWSLYGRGLDKLRKGMSAEGKADMAASVAVRPSIADEAAKHGIAP
jgi:tetratricopeptide (TPR) repeat protein